MEDGGVWEGGDEDVAGGLVVDGNTGLRELQTLAGGVAGADRVDRWGIAEVGDVVGY